MPRVSKLRIAVVLSTCVLAITSCAGVFDECCKVCKKGKACGDTCINASYTCHEGPGCACDE